jgi:hypothetical protein
MEGMKTGKPWRRCIDEPRSEVCAQKLLLNAYALNEVVTGRLGELDRPTCASKTDRHSEK